MDITDLPVKYDEKFADRLRRMSWQRSTHGYARHAWSDGQRTRWVSMHRLVWAWEHGKGSVPRYIDHINGDRMDNRLCNLRPATLSLNAHNCAERCERVKPLPHGVYLNRLSGASPYGACISHHNKTLYLGVFASVEEASAAYADAKRKIMDYEAAVARGESPDPPGLSIKRGVRGRPKRMQHALAKALHDSGKSLAQIACELGCCVDTARRLLRDQGVVFRRGRPPRKAVDATSQSQ
jgi:hypothetical protein